MSVFKGPGAVDGPADPENTSARWLVSGRVQGVGFRWFVLNAARRYGIRGDVRNLADGRVEVRVCGVAADVEGLLGDVRRGPSGSQVAGIENREGEPGLRFDNFEVRD